MHRLALVLVLMVGAAGARADSEFLLRGQDLEHQRPPLSARALSEYQASIDRLQHSGSCLVDDPALAESALALNWPEVRTLPDLQVCVFALADRARSPTDLVAALQRSGFATERLLPVEPVIARSYGVEGGAFHVNAAMAVEVVPTSFGRRMDRWFATSLSVSLVIGADGAPHDARAFYNQE